MESPTWCPGLHLPPEQPGCVRLEWLPETRRTAHVRVVRHTCGDCQAVTYELCVAGGLMFIRRTDRTKRTPQVHETERLITCRARAMWRDLLLGFAR
ncbi:hypothetical protein GCM10010116_15710 [Microbispora rosea subsp. aerata]|nr:hypothetical protein GCM10010116_15710 [Microbispora rosea subsp. aerata]GIH53269.1 hypothetical protein Mro02_01830 [Microbispora rosea subsp. aerata]GLJ83817.1 hypothetical protein GCM10017588_25450 [Microbispora rosea subsp. aerata]